MGQESLVETATRVIDSGEGSFPLPVGTMGQIERIAEGIYFLPIFSNVIVLDSGDGLVLVDSGPMRMGGQVVAALRQVSSEPVSAVIYTHGHVDHVFGVEAIEESQSSPVTVYAHEAVPLRFERYKLTAGYNTCINRRQFGFSDIRWPQDYRFPDVTYADRYSLEVGSLALELCHAKGETDDHTWVWVADKGLICTGDLIIWCTPNAGNPQKVQRYPKEWAEALRQMAALEAEVLLPGHGLPIVGAARVARVLSDTAELLEQILSQTLELMNQGLPLDEILARVRFPESLIQKPYLRPIYDDPEFIVRNVWRLYGGWYDGNPAHLKPPRFDDIAHEIASMVGGARALAERARSAADRGDLRLAAYLAELAGRAAGGDSEVASTRKQIFELLAEKEPSLMAKNIYREAARLSASEEAS
jgi:glyoxylase-like metal-dependent hydrolase (beta-lactamase superfamily II)